MENFIQDMIDYLEDAEEELRPRVVAGENGPLEDCAEKISEALTAANNWRWTIENGGTVLPADIEEMQGDVHDAQDSVKEYLDNIDWKDGRVSNVYEALDRAISRAESFLEDQGE
ncbi:MAG: hypothetical protein LUH19_01610 [Lachnospiraceae bacterium]|nr:hypothetical protein [Lachnospiraceae bacterium]